MKVALIRALGCIAITLVAIPVLLVLLFILFGRDYTIQLPYGYELSRVYSGAVLLASPSKGVLIDPNIDSYRVSGHVLVGRRSPVVDGPPPHYSRIYGYFIVDLRSGQLQQGLTYSELLRELRSNGIKEQPVLRSPSRYDKFLRVKEIQGR